jgi:hypothetical protein
MQKIYSTSRIGRFYSISKFFLTLVSFLFLNFSNLKAQTGGNLNFDGVDDYATLGPNVVQGIGVGYTFEAWVYWKGNAGSGTTWQRIFDIGSSTSNWVALTVDNGSGNPLFGTNISGSQITFQATAALPQNAWAHIAVTVDPTGVGTFYINGIARGTGGGFTNPLSLMGPTTNNWLGRSQFAPPMGSDPYFNGQIEEFRISNIVRYTTDFAPVPTVQFASDINTIALYHFNEGSGQTIDNATGNAAFDGVLGADATVESSDPTWSTTSILPIKLTSVAATLVNNKTVDIKWTASLDRASEFVVERSSTGSNFTAIGSVKRATGTNGFENFSFQDNAPLNGRSFYRLKCIETGSAPFYSKIVAIAISAKENFIVYPNPANRSTITVELPKAHTGNIEFSISSTSGAVIFKQKINAVDQKEFRLPKTAFVPGTYLLEVNISGIKRSTMIIYQ